MNTEQETAQQQAQRKRSLAVIAIIIVAGLVLSWLVMTLKPAPAPKPPETEPPHPADVLVALPAERAIRVVSQGVVTPRTEIDITSQVAGQVVEVAAAFAAGGRFDGGEVLLRIDPRDYEIRLVQAESRLAAARRDLALEQGQARQAEREWRELGNPQANALSLRKPQLAAAEAGAKAAEADLRQARLDLERTAISLPFAGRVVDTTVNLGQYVGAGTALAQVFASDVMEVRLPLTLRQITLLNLKNVTADFAPLSVALQLRAGDHHYRWQGQLVRVEPHADTDSRLYHVVVDVRDSGDEHQPPLMPGSFVTAEIVSNPFAEVVAVPAAALYQRDRLLVLDAERQLTLATVEVLEVSEQGALVRGVEEGTLVLVEPPAFLELGARYQPRVVDTVDNER